MVRREKKCMAYDLHPVFIPYSVSQKSKKLKCFDECFLITVKLGNKERFDKGQIGIKEPFPVTNLPFTS